MKTKEMADMVFAFLNYDERIEFIKILKNKKNFNEFLKELERQNNEEEKLMKKKHNNKILK